MADKLYAYSKKAIEGMTNPKLFEPIKVGAKTLQHRVVLAPMTRFRGTQKGFIPVLPLVKTYYTQRASRPGTLLITEGTFISEQSGGADNVPGFWNQDQITAWKEVTDSVHANGSVIYLQLWALGRSANAAILKERGFDVVSASAKPLKLGDVPRPLEVGEIREYVQWYTHAAKNAVEAGFDGVEIHNANGYLLDQFLQDVSNSRTDEYGGSIEARSKFSLEVIDAIVKAVGADRVGIRFSPWSTFQEMGMADPIPQFSYITKAIVEAHPNLAFLHVVEPMYSQNGSNDFLRKIWGPRPFISCGGYTRETAVSKAEETGDLIAFAKHFLANPDLVDRIQKSLPFNPYSNKTFYAPQGHVPGTESGYIDYPFVESDNRINTEV